MKASTLKEVFMLPDAEKVRLARDLLDSITRDEEELTPAEKKFIEERMAAYKANPESAMTLEQVYKQLNFKPKRKRRLA